MKSIKTKIALLVFLCTFVACTAIGIISVYNSKSVIAENSAQIMTEACENRQGEIDSYLTTIEQSVDSLADYILSSIDDMESFKSSDKYVDTFTDSVTPFLNSCAINTNGAVVAYVRYNPDFTYPTSGVLITRNNLSDPFESVPCTDFSVYEKSDLAHVGWYYIPVNNGQPTWMSPYLNENVGIYMISYVVPLYKDGESIGIVGMDIDFTMIEEMVDKASVYETMSSFIINEDKEIMYCSSVDFGTSLNDLNENSDFNELCSAVENENSEGSLISIEWENSEKDAVFSSLHNGMKLVMTADVSEINQNSNELNRTINIAAFLIMLISATIAFVITSNIIKPLIVLNNAAKKIAAGNLDVAIEHHGKDEIGMLSESISLTVSRLHDYIEYINQISDVLNNIAQGNLDFTLTKDYAGEFSKIKKSMLNISDSLSRTLTEIHIAAQQVTGGSEQVASGAQALAQSSTQQASSVQELSNAIKILKEKTTDNTNSVSVAFDASTNAADGMKLSSENIVEMTSAMNAIADASQKINNIVRTVDDIAQQTNILAINATIEAAHAGEAGKGFAVVAGEIQTLASKTADATKNISQLVNNVMCTVDEGTKITAKVNVSISQVSKVSRIVEQQLKSIAESSEQQLQAVESVNHGVQQISAVIQTNSATAQQSAAASEEMSGQARMLEERISQFKLKSQ